MDVKSVSLSPFFPVYYRALESAADWNVQDTDGAYECLITGDVVHSQPVTTPRCVISEQGIIFVSLISIFWSRIITLLMLMLAVVYCLSNIFVLWELLQHG